MPPVIDESKCTGCWICLDICPAGVFDFRDEKAIVAGAPMCYDCYHCLIHCPFDAISVVHKKGEVVDAFKRQFS